jgi:hypothetical protein
MGWVDGKHRAELAHRFVARRNRQVQANRPNLGTNILTSLQARPMVTRRRPQAEINFLGAEFRGRFSSCSSHRAAAIAQSRGIGMPKIPTEYLDSIFYLYETAEDAAAGIEFGGSGFLASVPSPAFPEQVIYTYAVTNWHTACQGSPVIRLNNKAGGHDILDLGPEDWTFIPKYDIAVSNITINAVKHRHSFVPMTMIVMPSDFVPSRHAIGVGDNVFMLGRFIDHDGGPTNRPAARFGNIAVLPAPIEQPNGIVADSFCLDLHSRTGFSGSPVFVWRSVGDDLDEIAETKNPYAGRGFLKFLGIHWGQFGEDLPARDASGQPTIVRGMSGMSCVLPAWSIKELLDLPKFANERVEEDKLTALWFAQHGRPPIAEHPAISLHHPKNVRED